MTVEVFAGVRPAASYRRTAALSRVAALDARSAVRLAMHLALGSLPVLGISADVFGWVPLHVLAVGVLLPLALVVGVLVVRDPHPLDRLIASAAGWGLLACAGYDAFRLPTIYVAHWWGDFFGSVGGWAVDGRSNLAVGYLWRYAGDGAGIAVAFFVLMALLPSGLVATMGRTIACGIAYGVCPVWSGLILTDALAPSGRELFPLTPRTLVLSLVGHLIYGSVLGIGWWRCRSQAFTGAAGPYAGSRRAGVRDWK